MITPVILAGGSGTRLWPLSRKSYPKQFADLGQPDTLFQATVKRLAGKGFRRPVLLTSEDYRFIVTEQMGGAGVLPEAIFIEPEARDTAPAVLIAALFLRASDPDGLMLIAPADHAIPETQAFRAAIEAAKGAAEAGSIVTFGITPDRPETGYGYLELTGEDHPSDVPEPLKAFVEKPNASRAKQMLASGQFLWNAGIFLVSVKAICDAFQQYAPEMLAPAKAALEGAERTGKAGFDPAQVLRGVQKTFLDLTLSALPFLVGLALAYAFGRKGQGADQTNRVNTTSRSVVFLVAWCAVTVIVFAFSTQLYERYILPALPAFAALIALLSGYLSKEGLTRGLKGAMWIFLPLPFLVLIVSLAFSWRFGEFAMAGSILCVGVLLLFGLWWISRKSSFLMGVTGLALVLPLFALALLPLHAFFLFPTAGQHVDQLGWSSSDGIVILDDPKIADDVGLQIGNIDRLHYRRSFDTERDAFAKHVLFLDAKHLSALEAVGYTVESFRIFRDLEIDMTDIQSVWDAGSPQPFIETRGEVFYVAHSG